MDLSELKSYLNYEPIMDDDPKFLIEEIKAMASEYYWKKELDMIQKAYNFIKKAHWNQKRLSWENYFIHPIVSTKFLMKIKPDIDTIIACILHDIIEDTDYTEADIANNFWKTVAKLCSSLVKVSKIKYRWEDRQIETLKKTFLSMWEDLRVIFIKLADRIHNIQTLHYHPKIEKRKRIALETLKIYVPIAQRLWLSVFQWYLENWAFKILNSKEFYRILTYIDKEFWTWEVHVKKWITLLNNILKKNKLSNNEVSWRFKSPYRIYAKLKKYWTNDIWKILDILAFRILTDDISQCYNVLWLIHSEFTPIINKIKDYIAVPKSNGYKSLHTVILWMFDFPIEIQIRTKEMDQVAEYWIAAHFAYKETGDSITVSEKQWQWIQQLQDLVKQFQEDSNKDKFKDALQVEILDKNIFVYTPKWDIVELPNRCSVLDFAFRIHTDVWLKFKHAFVNSKPVPIDYELKTWDIVDIKIYKNKYTASKSWIDYLYMSSSKSKLNRYLKLQEKKYYILEWTKLLNEKLKKFKLPLLGSKDNLISKKYKWEELDNLLMNIWDKQIQPYKFMKDIYKNLIIEEEKEPINKKSSIVKKTLWNQIIIDNDKVVSFIICPECKPKLWDKIIAKVWKEWIKIHSIKCKSMKEVSFDKLLEAHWEDQEPNNYIFILELLVDDKPGTLLQILTIFYELDINMSDIQIRQWLQKWYSHIDMKLQIRNPSKSFYVIKELKNKKNLLKIDKCYIS
jgi:guanosine-3',5'-bis(diphosphate) 3'-pyrophosphohydrolase